MQPPVGRSIVPTHARTRARARPPTSGPRRRSVPTARAPSLDRDDRSRWRSDRCRQRPGREPPANPNSLRSGVVAVALGHDLWRALSFAFGMTWEILWALVLGFLLSSIVQALVSRRTVERAFPDNSPRSLAIAAGLGIASSSCSYASVALARSLFRKGADFTASIVFEIASTNLVVELGIVMAIILGWQFTVGEFVGGPLMIVAIALLFRVFLSRRLADEARLEANRGRHGYMEGHAEMRMTAVAEVYVMEWTAVLRDVVGGLLIAGALAAWVPDSFWRSLFLTGH